ncbi:MAG TPA: GNAT family protein [Micromonosporaceae bacterium]|nr:GNAT family protein [Micromonosporaceae bacterium]
MFSVPLAEGAQLRPLEPWQAAEFLANVEHSRPHIAPWVPLAGRVVDLDSARKLLQQYADSQAADTGRLYGIWLDGTLVGCALFRVFDTREGVCEVGVWIAPEAQGRGLVTRAVRHMVDWAIRVRGMSRVEWCNVPTNVRSRAVVQRLGFTLDGVLRSVFELGGVRQDLEVWSMLAGEWPPDQPS